ncbi:MAG: HAD hydrolase-like protein [Planctomycetota bacterium]|nr:HAD hydrolase-like protein [Planctomycetota bacterium]
MNRLDSMRGWIFQLGGVLYDGTAWKRWLLKLLSKRGLQTHYQLFYRHWDLEFVPHIRSGAISFQGAVETMLAQTGMNAAHVNEILPAIRNKRKSLTNEERLLPGVVELLESLRQEGHSLALWSHEHCDQELIGDKIARLGLTRYFDFVAQADKLVHGRVPDRLLARTLSALRVARESVAFVGYAPESLRAARMIGLRTVGIGNSDADLSDWRLDGVVELQHLIRRRLRRAG